MKKVLNLTLVLLLAVLFISPGLLAQSHDTGTLDGKVTDEEDIGLPGVQITINSPNLMGTRSMITDADGKYRFILLPAGVYTVEAELQGFTPARRENIRVHVDTTFHVDFKLNIAKVEEEITVTGQAPIVDVQESQTGKVIITNDFLLNIPSARNLNQIYALSPGVENNSSFGGAEHSSNAYHLDGVDFTEGAAGGNWIDVNYNTLEEFQIHGRGAPAEYGGYTGTIVNAVSKSGGNTFEGMVEFLYQGWTWRGDNFNPDDPKYALLPKAPEQRYIDLALHLGGPLIKDKLWFFGAFSYQKTDNDVGFDVYQTDRSPLGFLKLTFQIDNRNNIKAFGEWGSNDWLRGGLGPLYPPEVASDVINKKFAYNIASSHILSANTFMEVKVAGYRAPQEGISPGGSDTPAHLDLSTGMWSGNSPFDIYYPMKRFQSQAALSHHAEDFLQGDHDFKFGVSYTRFNFDQNLAVNGGYLYYDNVPGFPWPGTNLAVHIGWQKAAVGHQSAFFAQDSWSVTDRFTLNAGLRYEIYRGVVEALGTLYKAEGLQPRIGFSWDITGDHRTALKAHYGRYNERLLMTYFADMDPGFNDQVVYMVLPTGDKLELSRVPLSESTLEIYSIDENIKQPGMNEFTIGIDRELIPDLFTGVNFIYRRWDNFVEQVDIGSDFAPVQVTDPDGNTHTVWNKTNPGNEKYLITNPDPDKDYGQVFDNIVSVEPYRRYWGVEFLVNKRFSNNWMLLASYIYSNAKGTISNWYAATQLFTYMFRDPNAQIFADGQLWIDPRHMFKAQGTVVLPLGFNFSGNLTITSGLTWADDLNLALTQGIVNVLTEPRGSKRLPARTNLDLRLEKTFAFGDRTKIGLMFDVFNVFNSGEETDVVTTVNSVTYGLATGIVLPRRFRVGVRIFF